LVWAQTGSTSAERIPSTSYDRLFLSFIEDATIVDRQWWEGQLTYSDGDDVTSTVLRGWAVFQPWRDVEIGGTIGFGWTNTEAPLPDGRGATDMDAWGKYYLARGETGKVDLAVGVLGTIPSGDESAGLGFDAFALGFFGSLRYNFSRVKLSANAGFQVNEDGRILSEDVGVVDLDGETSERLGLGVVIPFGDRLNLTVEGFFQGERFDTSDDIGRFAAGTNWRLGTRGLIRGAVAVGATDGAPNFEALVSYAVQFP
jgi:hypothetical protein